MPIKPKNDKPGGMSRTATSAGTVRTKMFKEYTTQELKDNPGIVNGIELGRRIMGDFYSEVKEMDKQWMLDKFIYFIEEREKVRKLKEQGAPRPWTEDEVIHRTKFTNIFREDDKVSAYIYSKVKGMDGEELAYNLLIGRLINRIDILSKVLPLKPCQDISFLLEGDNPVILNPQAYQISPGLVKYNDYATVREYVVYETASKADAVFKAITSTLDINEATDLGNKAYGGNINFVMFQIVLDYHHLTGHYVIGNEIRIGQGGKAIIDRLQDNMSESSDSAEKVRPNVQDIGWLVDYVNNMCCLDRVMTAIDVEHAACEFRKYLYRQGKVLSRYSYKPNSMGIDDEDTLFD